MRGRGGQVGPATAPAANGRHGGLPYRLRMMDANYRRRKNIRLSRDIYSKSSLVFSITICTKKKRTIFRKKEWAKKIIKTLKTGPFGNGTECYAYCLMPDHLHLQLSPRDGNLIDLINGWKSYTANLLRKSGLEGSCWQRSFYDHVLRNDEDVKTVAEYIIQNPVRSKLVDRWDQYPYSWHTWM